MNVYETITEQIVASLEAGVVPWHKPWTPGNAPRNISGHIYRGINLWLVPTTYKSPFWLTFNQAKKLGGTVKKGEKSTMVIFWKIQKIDDNGQDKTIPMLRYYRVFNVEQTENVKLPKSVVEFDAQGFEHDPIEAAEAIWDNYPSPPALTTGFDAAYYVPLLDQIAMPDMSRFPNVEEYYSTLFHEAGHSTGHPDRLGRYQPAAFGSHTYGREELVAEMTAAFLCTHAGITTTHENSAAYLASWIRTISEDTKAVITAAGQAQKAADHILGVKHENNDDE